MNAVGIVLKIAQQVAERAYAAKQLRDDCVSLAQLIDKLCDVLQAVRQLLTSSSSDQAYVQTLLQDLQKELSNASDFVEETQRYSFLRLACQSGQLSAKLAGVKEGLTGCMTRLMGVGGLSMAGTILQRLGAFERAVWKAFQAQASNKQAPQLATLEAEMAELHRKVQMSQLSTAAGVEQLRDELQALAYQIRGKAVTPSELEAALQECRAELLQLRGQKQELEDMMMGQIMALLESSSAGAARSSSAVHREPPRHLLCPISLELMADPVVLVESGHVFDRRSIQEWLGRGHRVCPISREALSSCRLVPVYALRHSIEEWTSAQNSTAGNTSAQQRQQQQQSQPQLRPQPPAAGPPPTSDRMDHSGPSRRATVLDSVPELQANYWPDSRGSGLPSSRRFRSALRDSDPTALQDVHPSRSLASDRKVVVGLDFGTYGTSISFKTMNGGEVSFCNRWPGRAEPPYPKALTAILYKGSEAIQWGWEAHNLYQELTDSQKQRGGYYYVTHLKLGLDSGSRPTCQLPPGKTIIQVIADFLRLFTKHCLEKVLPDVYGHRQLRPGSIQWCLTVPAIWKDDQKDAMRQAAYLAGMIPDRGSDLLRIILEPEAAALTMADMLNLQPQQTMMMLDANGGTVELTVHTVMRTEGQLVLEETVPGDGDFCGSAYVDRDFEACFRVKVGASVFDAWKKQNYREYDLLMMTNWEEQKRLFKGGPRPCSTAIIIPPRLLEMVDDIVVLQLEEETGYDDRVIISQQQMKAFFEPHILRIVDLARRLARMCPGGFVDKILLVGVFCTSPYLVASLKERLGGVACPTHHIYVPEAPEFAILQGAALA